SLFQEKSLPLCVKIKKEFMKYYSQYRTHDLFELQQSLSGLSKSNRWVKLADNLPWDKIEKDMRKPQTHRVEARQAFISCTKKKRKSKKLIDKTKLTLLRCL
ncbi:MAG: hypothetical protein J6W75_02745, partial [Bacteroidaceae bacterium]|nr:hypothetical protein [Bacteroidaceae bacterium]